MFYINSFQKMAIDPWAYGSNLSTLLAKWEEIINF